jgi:hypothetical protein
MQQQILLFVALQNLLVSPSLIRQIGARFLRIIFRGTIHRSDLKS